MRQVNKYVQTPAIWVRVDSVLLYRCRLGLSDSELTIWSQNYVEQPLQQGSFGNYANGIDLWGSLTIPTKNEQYDVGESFRDRGK